MLMRSFTRREKVLLVILVLIVLVGVYVLAVHNPTTASLEALAAEKDELDVQLQVANIRLVQYERMKTELEEIFAQPKDKITVMPNYTKQRQEELFTRFNGIFMGLDPKISFPAVTFQDSVATRPVDFEFTAESYDQARALLSQLTRTGQRSLLNALSFRPEVRLNGIREGAVKVSGTIFFYELAPGMSGG